MAVFLVFFLSLLVVGEVNNATDKTQKKKRDSTSYP